MRFSGLPAATFVSPNTLIYIHIFLALILILMIWIHSIQFVLSIALFDLYLFCMWIYCCGLYLFILIHLISNRKHGHWIYEMCIIYVRMNVCTYVCMYMVLPLKIVFTLGSDNLEPCMFTNYLHHIVRCRMFYQL